MTSDHATQLHTHAVTCLPAPVQTLRMYEAKDSEESGGVGPPRPARPGESLQQTISRFRHCLSRFTDAPWTMQRLCEVLLAPQMQYTKLHKVRDMRVMVLDSDMAGINSCCCRVRFAFVPEG